MESAARWQLPRSKKVHSTVDDFNAWCEQVEAAYSTKTMEQLRLEGEGGGDGLHGGARRGRVLGRGGEHERPGLRGAQQERDAVRRVRGQLGQRQRADDGRAVLVRLVGERAGVDGRSQRRQPQARAEGVELCTRLVTQRLEASLYLGLTARSTHSLGTLGLQASVF